MHAEARDFLRRISLSGPVVEFGSRNINGSARDVFPELEWIGVDIADGPGVDVVCDAATFSTELMPMSIVCCEVLEHAANWREIIRNSCNMVGHDGILVITCAGPGRKPHSAIDGGPLRDGEYYRNLSAAEIRAACLEAGFRGVYADQAGFDTRAIAWM
jgi:hypothetical protein